MRAWIKFNNVTIGYSGGTVTHGSGPSVSVKGGEFLEKLQILAP